jgi:uncharacterized membrane protein
MLPGVFAGWVLTQEFAARFRQFRAIIRLLAGGAGPAFEPSHSCSEARRGPVIVSRRVLLMQKRGVKVQAVNDHETAEKNRIGLDRLIFFSDAVFAIAITVLVLDIHLPAGGDSANNDQLLHMLAMLWTKYFAYVLSFWVIGLYWISHHRKFLLIKRFDSRLLGLNLLLLMVIAFIPFPTAVLSENGNRTATVFYALIMALGGLLVTLLWWHATRHHKLVDPHLDRRFVWREMIPAIATSAVFILSIGIAYMNVGLSRLMWIILLPLSLYLNARRDTA